MRKLLLEIDMINDNDNDKKINKTGKKIYKN